MRKLVNTMATPMSSKLLYYQVNLGNYFHANSLKKKKNNQKTKQMISRMDDLRGHIFFCPASLSYHLIELNNKLC